MKKVYLLCAFVAAMLITGCATSFERVNQTMVRVQEPEVGTVATPIVMELGEIPQQKIVDTTVVDVDSYRTPNTRSYQRITPAMVVAFKKKPSKMLWLNLTAMLLFTPHLGFLPAKTVRPVALLCRATLQSISVCVPLRRTTSGCWSLWGKVIIYS